jgi:hypothetical protein
MIGLNEERWRELCEQVAVEQDPKKLVELTTEIYRLLEEREDAFREEAFWMPRYPVELKWSEWRLKTRCTTFRRVCRSMKRNRNGICHAWVSTLYLRNCDRQL